MRILFRAFEHLSKPSLHTKPLRSFLVLEVAVTSRPPPVLANASHHKRSAHLGYILAAVAVVTEISGHTSGRYPALRFRPRNGHDCILSSVKASSANQEACRNSTLPLRHAAVWFKNSSSNSKIQF